MANAEQLAIIRNGAKAWNAWRERNLGAHVDLCAADLRHVDAILVNADLRKAQLGAHLNRVAGFAVEFGSDRLEKPG